MIIACYLELQSSSLERKIGVESSVWQPRKETDFTARCLGYYRRQEGRGRVCSSGDLISPKFNDFVRMLSAQLLLLSLVVPKNTSATPGYVSTLTAVHTCIVTP